MILKSDGEDLLTEDILSRGRPAGQCFTRVIGATSDSSSALQRLRCYMVDAFMKKFKKTKANKLD